MKKSALRRMLFLTLAALLCCLSACSSGGLDLPDETAAVPAAETETDGDEGDEYSVGTPYTRAMLEAIPVANASMKEDELRAICLSFAKMQGTIPWITSQKVRYNLSDSKEKEMVFGAGQIYAGLPYTHAGSNLYTFMDYLDEETGLLDESMTNRVGDLLGDNCCTSLFWAWSRVSSSITFTHTQALVPKTGIVTVGPYTFDQSIDSYKRPTTKDICDANGEQTMFESYAALKVADGIVVNTQTTAAGAHHVVMCSVLPHVVRTPEGRINGSESYLYVVDQSSGFTYTTLENGMDVVTNAGIDKKVYFSNLYFQGYLPFTIPEFLNPKTVQKAAVGFPFENGAQIGLSELEEVVLTSNYAISKLIVTVTAPDGKVSDFSSYARGVAKYTMELKSRCVTMERQLKAGEYTVGISALVGSGETVPVFTGTLVKD